MAVREVIEQRREQVKTLILNGYGIEEIAKELGWNKNTIMTDLNKVRATYRNKVLKEHDDPVVDFLMRNEEQYKAVSNILRMTDDEKIKLQCIREQRELDAQRMTVQQTLGILPKQLGSLNVRSVNLSLTPERIFDIMNKKKEMEIESS